MIELPFFGDMPNEAYRDYPALSQSALKLIGITPWHYHNPPEYKDSPAKSFGRMFHCLVLEPAEFDERYLVTKLSRRTNAFKRLSEEEELELVTEEQYEKARHMMEALMANPDAAEFCEVPAETEKTVIATLLGRPCKARIDYYPLFGNLWDLKTFGGVANPRQFMFRVRDFGYHMQAWLYCELVRLATGEDRGWSWVVIESSDRPAVQVYNADETLLDEGRRLFEKYLDKLEECEALDHWPNSYTEGPYTLMGEAPDYE